MFAALALGVGAAFYVGEGPNIPEDMAWLSQPILVKPVFSIVSMIELVIPLVISVIAVQNVQGVSVLRSAGYHPPVNVMTVVCGYGSFIMGILGSVPTCITGPVNAILVSSGEKGTHFIGAIIFGALFAIVGLFAPLLTEAATSMSRYFIMVLGGLAMLPILTAAFSGAFGDGAGGKPNRVAALIAFIVTISDFSILNIAAPFWGLVFGYFVHLLLQRRVA